MKYRVVKESVMSSLVGVCVYCTVSSVWSETPVAAAARSPAVVTAPPAPVVASVLDDGRSHRDIHVIADYESEIRVGVKSTHSNAAEVR